MYIIWSIWKTWQAYQLLYAYLAMTPHIPLKKFWIMLKSSRYMYLRYGYHWSLTEILIRSVQTFQVCMQTNNGGKITKQCVQWNYGFSIITFAESAASFGKQHSFSFPTLPVLCVSFRCQMAFQTNLIINCPHRPCVVCVCRKVIVNV